MVQISRCQVIARPIITRLQYNPSILIGSAKEVYNLIEGSYHHPGGTRVHILVIENQRVEFCLIFPDSRCVSAQFTFRNQSNVDLNAILNAFKSKLVTDFQIWKIKNRPNEDLGSNLIGPLSRSLKPLIFLQIYKILF